VTSPALDAPSTGSGDERTGPALVEALRQTAAIAGAEMRKIRRDPTEIFSRSVQPILWLLVFGQVFARTRAIPTGSLDYLAFMTPGILAQSVLFTGIFYGIAIIWERDLGIVHKLLVSPAFRSSLVLGKAVAAGARGVVQAVVIYVVAAVLRVKLDLSPLAVLGVLLAVGLGGAIFATFSLVIACLVKTRERFMGIGQVLTMPLFFASNAIYPVEMMPGWLRVASRLNPLTYLVDLLRSLMVHGGHSQLGFAADAGVLGAVLVGLVVLAARLYPSVAR
jgi:ABC-2 type transport system permease protein